MKYLFYIITAFTLSACISTGRYSQSHDSAPKRLPQTISMEDAQIKYEPYSRGGNGNYEVFGKRYYPMDSGKDHSEVGHASWYGQKFHGHLTSNGEIYDMYSMSAAHKTLPLPSLVRVTNQSNNKQVIVRVNDRGPFHGDRIIDLSYAAAMKLDMLKTGTAKVKLDVIHVTEDGAISIAGEIPPPAPSQSSTMNADLTPPPKKALFIQVAAIEDAYKVNKMAKGLAMLYQVNTQIPDHGGIYRLQLGPLATEQDAERLLEQLHSNGYSGAYKLYATN